MSLPTMWHQRLAPALKAGLRPSSVDRAIRSPLRSLSSFSSSPDVDIETTTLQSFQLDTVMTKVDGAGGTHIEDEARPLAIVSGWLNAKPRQLRSYLRYYHQRGIDTLSFQTTADCVMFPRRSLTMIDRLVDVLHAHPVKTVEKQRPIVWHGFSVGAGFNYGNLLLALKREENKDLRSLLCAQIFDSAIDIEGIPKGVAASAGLPNKWLTVLIESIIAGYLTLSEFNEIGKIYRQSQSAFWSNRMKVESLFLASETDKVARLSTIQRLVDQWKAVDLPVTLEEFSGSAHVVHAREHPEQYFQAIDNVLERVLGSHQR